MYMDKVLLKDLLTIKNGRACNYGTSGIYAVYGSGGIIGYNNNYIYENASILLPRKGTLNNIIYVENPFWTIDTIYYTVINNTELCDIKYLFYYLSLLKLDHKNSGSAQPSMTFNAYYNIPVKLPNIKVQKIVSKLITSIDNKIQINKKINSELEQMAKTLYNYWFVQFDFPDENGRPYKSSGGKMVYNEELKKEIPEGWEVKKCKDILDVITGNEDVNFTSENGIYPFFSCSKQVFKCDKYAFDGLAILIAGNGDFNVKAYKGKFNAYQRTYVLMPDDENYFAILYLSALNTINKFKVGANGAIVKFIRKKDIENIPLVIPNNKNLLKILNDLLYYQLHINNYNQELTSLRDFLLPLLMNGQAVISD